MGCCWLCLVTLTLEWGILCIRVLCSPAPCIIAFGCGDYVTQVLLCFGLVCALGVVLYIHAEYHLYIQAMHSFIL
jgi:hypothetical protein